MISHKVYINGGKRSDSLSDYNAPRLSHEDSAKLVKSHSSWILETLAQKMGLGKEFAEAEKYRSQKIYLYKTLTLTTLFFLHPIGNAADRVQARRMTTNRSDWTRKRTGLPNGMDTNCKMDNPGLDTSTNKDMTANNGKILILKKVLPRKVIIMIYLYAHVKYFKYKVGNISPKEVSKVPTQ